MHESTVSRVTSNKYIATPRGLFELKYFFTASIQSTDGTESHSAEAVRDRIREMILARKPTSEIRRAAREEGMRFLRESALDKVRLGMTTLKEINKVTFIETMR